ncbi:MAG: DNA-directed RNA polymerase subunit alpha C-terminal domain-containing protein [Daejeonella sp.]
MTIVKKALRTCNKGHNYYRSSDCLVCPHCEAERKPKDNFLALLAAPARRALENKGITTIQQLSKFTEHEILELHGMGKSSIPKLRIVLEKNSLSFKKYEINYNQTY